MISSVFCCRVGAGHEKWQNGLKNQVADLTLFQFLKRALCGELSILTSPSKRKCDLFQQVAFSFGFRFCWSLHPSVSRCSGSAKPPARRPVGCFSSKIANDLREFGLLPLAISRKITAKLAVIFRLTMMKLQTTIKALAWIGNQNVPYQNLHGFTTNQALLLLHRITLEL